MIRYSNPFFIFGFLYLVNTYIILVSGIPMLIVLKSDGNMVTKNGRETIKLHGSNALKEWITSTHIFETISSSNVTNE